MLPVLLVSVTPYVGKNVVALGIAEKFRRGGKSVGFFKPIGPLPAYPSTLVRDPTGAGDSFAGGMMGSLAAGGKYDFPHLMRAMAYGTVTASFAIEDFGLRRFDRLTIDEIDGRLREYHEMLEF